MKNRSLFICLILGIVGGLATISSFAEEAANQKRYPLFSWDSVPIAFHFGKSDSLMTPEEARFVAERSNFICLEKGHATGQFGSTEKGIEMEARQLKALNPNIKVIFYWNTFLDYAMYDAHDEYQKHPDWWLRTVDGDLDLKNGNLKRYDLSNANFRAWWTDVAQDAIVDGSTDGVFMDAFPQVASKANIPLWGQEKYDAIQHGLKAIIEETREKLGEDKLIVYNGIRSLPTNSIGYEFPEHTDAAMVEHFGQFNSASKEAMLRDIQEMEKAGKNGKIVAFKGWPGFTWIDKDAMKKSDSEKRKIAAEAITFPLAAFLVGAQENCYFIYNWGYRMELGCLEWYPEYDRPLGKPLGDMKVDGWQLSREYEHLSVWVDLETREAIITPREHSF